MAKNILRKIKEKQEEEKVLSTEIDPDRIVQEIKKGYEAKNSSGYRKRNSFTPSGLTYGAGHCPRFWFLWFEGNNATSSNTWYDVANMDSGSDRHTRLEDAFEKAGVLVNKEKSLLFDDPPISGRTDAIINIDGREVLTEIKTVNDDSFGYIRKPRRYHVEQLLIYMKILQEAVAFLIYENKNNHEIKVYPIHVTQHYKDFINYFFDWMRSVKKAFDENQLPENPYRNKYNSKNCKGCDFLEACQQKPVGDIKIESRKELE